MSQLERLAEAVVQVGQQSGPVMQSVSRTEQAANRVAASVPNDEAGYARTIRTQLYEGVAALRDVERLLTDFDKQANAFAKRLVGGPSAEPGPSADTATPDSEDWLSAFGLSMVNVNDLDLSDNPILGEFGRGGLSRDDYEWLVSTWSTTVAPGVARGMTRDGFANLDAQSGAGPGRRTVDVYDIFLTSDPIHLSRRPDGSLDIGGGRHRIAIAKALGIGHLPARFH